MMAKYYPYLRGKQYELILLRESIDILAPGSIKPILEPVKDNLKSLSRCVDAMRIRNVGVIIVANPNVGELAYETRHLQTYLKSIRKIYPALTIGVIVDGQMTADALGEYEAYGDVAFVHYGQAQNNVLEMVCNWPGGATHIFDENRCGKLYRRKFRNQDSQRVLIRDGFVQQKNADYPSHEHFSDLHVTYGEEGMQGFSDYLTVGAGYSETGGPAYAIAIHLTYIDSDSDMQICHFVSDRQKSPVDPAGKFIEALEKLVGAIEGSVYPIQRTLAVEEFFSLHERRHFPGLGYVKKLSMMHHLELLESFLRGEQ